MNLTISVGDIIAAATFVFYAGMTYRTLKQHGEFIGELRRWKHREVAPQMLDLKLRVGLLEEGKGNG